MTDSIIPRIRDILASHRMTASESFALTRLVVDAAEKTTTTADRERIAELERDLAQLRVDAGAVNDALGILDLVQAPGVIDTVFAELNELRALKAAADAYVVGAAVVEEQGPWVVHDSHPHASTRWCGEMDESGNDWRRNPADVTPFPSRFSAEKYVETFVGGKIHSDLRVITLAEARAIAGVK